MAIVLLLLSTVTAKGFGAERERGVGEERDKKKQ